MPYYQFECRTGHETLKYFGFAEVPPIGSSIRCAVCGLFAVRLLSNPNIAGSTRYSGLERLEVSLGRKFTSVKEVDRFIKKKGLVHAGEHKQVSAKKLSKITADDIKYLE